MLDAYYFRRLKVAQQNWHTFPNDFDPTIVPSTPRPALFPYHVSMHKLFALDGKKAELRVMMLGAYCYRFSNYSYLVLRVKVMLSPFKVAKSLAIASKYSRCCLTLLRVKVLPLLAQNEQKFAPIFSSSQKGLPKSQRKANLLVISAKGSHLPPSSKSLSYFPPEEKCDENQNSWLSPGRAHASQLAHPLLTRCRPSIAGQKGSTPRTLPPSILSFHPIFCPPILPLMLLFDPIFILFSCRLLFSYRFSAP